MVVGSNPTGPIAGRTCSLGGQGRSAVSASLRLRGIERGVFRDGLLECVDDEWVVQGVGQADQIFHHGFDLIPCTFCIKILDWILAWIPPSARSCDDVHRGGLDGVSSSPSSGPLRSSQRIRRSAPSQMKWVSQGLRRATLWGRALRTRVILGWQGRFGRHPVQPGLPLLREDLQRMLLPPLRRTFSSFPHVGLRG